MLGYCIGLVIIGGGFALACSGLRWLLTKMGTPGTGQTQEVSVLDPTYGLMNAGPDDINAMGTDSSRWEDVMK